MDRDSQFVSEAEEDIRVNRSFAERAFNRGLRRNGTRYLDELKSFVSGDIELEEDLRSIEQTFSLLKTYIEEDGRGLSKMGLSILEEFGLNKYVVDRIGLSVARHDSDSPPPNQIGRGPVSKLRSSRESSDSRSARRLERLVSRGQSEEYYDDDFEDEIEEEESLEGLGEGSSMERSGAVAPPKAGGPLDRSRHLQEKHAEDSEEEIADETVEAPYQTSNRKELSDGNQRARRYDSDDSDYVAAESRNNRNRGGGGGGGGGGINRFSRIAPMEVELRSPGSRAPPNITSPAHVRRPRPNGDAATTASSSTAATAAVAAVAAPARPTPRAEDSSSSSPSKPRVTRGTREDRGSRDSHNNDTGTSDVEVNSNNNDNNNDMVMRSRTSAAASTSDIARRSKRKSKAMKWISAREWRKGEKIGSGSFGEVYQGMNFQGKLFAVKRMNVVDKPSEVKSLLGEIDLMRGLSHPHIVEYIGAYVDQDEGALFIFQEWVPGGSVAHLLQKFGPFPVGVVREYTRQILQGLQYLHSNGIVHRDIKGGNILVDDSGQVKLADFGASTKLSQFDQTQETTTIKGTPYFMAPEVLASSKYGRKGDVWAVGCTMIQMLTGQPPWKDRNLKGLVQLHLLLNNWSEGPPPHDKSNSTPDCEDCLKMCFRKDENERPSVVELMTCRFMQDELDESGGNSSSLERQFTRQFTGLNTTGGSDMLEESRTMKDLQQEINAAVTRSQAGALSSRHEETISAIDQRMPSAQAQVRRNSRAQSDNPFASPQSDKQITPRSQLNSQQERQRRGSRAAPDNPFGSNHSGDTPRTAATSAAAALGAAPVSSRPSSNRQHQQQQMLEIAEQQVKWAQEQNGPSKYSARGSRGSRSSRGSHGSHANGSPTAQYASITSKTPPAEGAHRRQSFDVDSNRMKRNSFSNPVTPVEKEDISNFAPALVMDGRGQPYGNGRSPRSVLNSPPKVIENAAALNNGPGSSGSSSSNPFGRGADRIKKFSPRVNQPEDWSPLTPNDGDVVLMGSRNAAGTRQPTEAIRESLTSLKAKRTGGSRAGSHMGSRHNSASSIDANINQSSNRDSEDITPYIDENSDNEYGGGKDGAVSYDHAENEIQRTRSDGGGGSGRSGYPGPHKQRSGIERVDSLEVIQEESHYAAVHPSSYGSGCSSRNPSRDGSESSDRAGAVADINHTPRRTARDARSRHTRSQEILDAPDDADVLGAGNPTTNRKGSAGMRRSASDTNTEYNPYGVAHGRSQNGADRQVGVVYGRQARNTSSSTSVSASGGAALLKREYPAKSESARAHRPHVSQDTRKGRPNTSTAALAGGQAVVMSPSKSSQMRTNSNASDASGSSGTSRRKSSFKDYGEFRVESVDEYGDCAINEVHDEVEEGEEEEEDQVWMCLYCGIEQEGTLPYCTACAHYRGSGGSKGAAAAINYRG